MENILTEIKPIGQVVKELREEKGWSLYRLAKETRIPYSTLSCMEREGKTANFDHIVKIAEALNIPLENFKSERRGWEGEEKSAC